LSLSARIQDQENSTKIERLIDFYFLAKSVVIGEGFQHEIDWQDGLRFLDLQEDVFLREAAWVVLSSGMRESVIRGKFPAISRAFHEWTSASQISANGPTCRKKAFRIFRHAGKIDSIVEIAKSIDRTGFDSFKQRIGSEGVPFLKSLPFIGPATCYHLAKNIGLDVVKPDRHLLRISTLVGYSDPTEFCKEISSAVGDRMCVVDLIVWRYATLNPGYKNLLTRYFC
jgi:hypothetical protein